MAQSGLMFGLCNISALRGLFAPPISLKISRNGFGLRASFKAISVLVFLLNEHGLGDCKAQIVYSQNFNSTTLAASGWTNTNLTVPWSSGTYFGFFSNNWYVNDAESGMPPNTCGAGGAGNPTLYMGAVGLGALGAAYVANAPTNRRISSPNINTVGYSGMTLSFNFIANGVGATDKAYFQYSIDGGVTWTIPAGGPTSTTPALQSGSDWSNLKSQVCSPQGRWTNVTWAIPASCENISNLRIGFVWQNGNTTPGATDPCLAIDDVVISVILSPVEMSSFDARCDDVNVLLEWTTQSEINNDYFTIESSEDLLRWRYITKVMGSGNANSINHYNYECPATGSGIYYRISQTDYDGRLTILRIISFETCDHNLDLSIYPNPTSSLFYIKGENIGAIASIRMFDRFGRMVLNCGMNKLSGNQIEILVPQSLTSGLYLLNVQLDDYDIREFKLIIE